MSLPSLPKFRYSLLHFQRVLLLSTLSIPLIWLPVSQAQITTAITSDNSLGTTVSQVGNVYNIDNGTIAGTNQFHSFGLFSVGEGDVASFKGPSGIENILSRVTGGMRSDIVGTISSTIEGANLFLLNPAGVIFGPTGSLDISGSFHASTADFVRMGQEGIFFVNPSGESILTTAPVEAFGFLNENPSGLTIERSFLDVPDGETISLIGGDITIMGNPGEEIPSLQAISGRINLASVASSGEVELEGPNAVPALKTDSFTALGNITMSEDAFLLLEDFGSTSGGTVMIRSGEFVMNNAAIFNETYADQAGGPVSIIADTEVTIGGPQEAMDSLAMENNTDPDSPTILSSAFVFTSTFGEGDGGALEIQAPKVNLKGNVQLQAGTGGTGKGGLIAITGDTVNLSEEAFVNSASGGPAKAGDVTINANKVKFSNSASIQNQVFDEGNGGAVTVIAQDVMFQHQSGIQTSTNPQNNPNSEGNAAPITIIAENVTLEDNSLLESGTETSGRAADINIEARNVNLRGEKVFIEGGTTGSGSGGSVIITADNVTLSKGATIGSVTAGPGEAGTVTLSVDHLMLTEGSQISSAAFADSSGQGGDVNVTAKQDIQLMNDASISAQSLGTKNAGNIFINAGKSFSVRE